MNRKLRVGVVGAGPAGSYLSFLLAEKGHDVLVFDPSFPREKPCGGGLSAKAVEEFEFIRQTKKPKCVIRRTRLVSPEDVVHEIDCPEPLYIFSRNDFDSFILEMAKQAGAVHVTEKVRNLKRSENAWRIFANGKEYEIDFIVGADGAKSTVRRRVARPFTKEQLTMTAGWYLDDLDRDSILIKFREGLSGYIWIFPRSDHSSVGICSKISKTTTREIIEQLRGFIRQSVNIPEEALSKANFYGAVIPSLNPSDYSNLLFCDADWALIGDAAGFVDSLTREGIYYALKSAELLTQAIHSGEPQSYRDLCREYIIPELKKAAQLAEKFYNAGFTELMISLSKEVPAISQVVGDMIMGNQSYLTLKRRLIELAMKNPVKLLKSHLMKVWRGVPFLFSILGH